MSGEAADHHRRKLIRAAVQTISANGLVLDNPEIFTASRDEWLLRQAAFEWQERNQLVVFGTDSPQPVFVRAGLAVGNLQLMQSEWIDSGD